MLFLAAGSNNWQFSLRYIARPALSHRRNEVLALQDASHQVVVIVLHPADGHIACGLGAHDVQPNGDVRELGALQLVDGAGIARPDWVCGHVPAVLHIVRHGVHCQVPAGLGHHMDALCLVVVVRDCGLHPVDEVGFLVDVTGQMQAHALVQPHLQGLRRLSAEELVVVVLVTRAETKLITKLDQTRKAKNTYI